MIAVPGPRYPALYQINTRVWLTALSHSLGRRATLDDIVDELDRLADAGFDWIWLLSVWQTGEAAQRTLRSHPAWRREFEHTLPDLREADIAGSGSAIHQPTACTTAWAATRHWRLAARRMRERGLRLMLDFVPNHMAPDHPWTDAHPDYFVPRHGRRPGAFAPELRPGGRRKMDLLLLAYGRDPLLRRLARHAAAWTTATRRCRRRMIGELRIASPASATACATRHGHARAA